MFFYLPIEPYENRYTLQLQEWWSRALHRSGHPHRIITPLQLQADASAAPGPLDARRRTRWALDQTDMTIEAVLNSPTAPDDIVFVQDMFHPGFEAMLYAFTLARRPVKIFAYNCAQTIDVYDFTVPMGRWMRPYEQMVRRACDGILFGSWEHVNQAIAAGWHDDTRLTAFGLHVDSEEIRERYTGPMLPAVKANRVIFASRLAEEKNIGFLVNVAAKLRTYGIDVLVASGNDVDDSTPPKILDALRSAEARGDIRIADNLSKAAYYQLLASSEVQLNTSLQDWVSNTMLEAMALGTVSVVPAFRGFIEEFPGEWPTTYKPWSVYSCADTIIDLFKSPVVRRQAIARIQRERVLAYHEASIDKTIDWCRGVASDPRPPAWWPTDERWRTR